MTDDRLNQWLEWIGTVVLILGTAVNSMGYYPAGPMMLCVGGLFWLAVAIRWKKISLIVVNIVMMLTAIGGMLWKYLS